MTHALNQPVRTWCSSPFFWYFALRLVLMMSLMLMCGFSFAYNYITLALLIFTSACGVAFVLMHKILRTALAWKPSPDAQHIRNMTAVAERTNNIVLITNHLGQIQWVNAAFTKITGYAFEEVVNLTAQEILNPSVESMSPTMSVEEAHRKEQFSRISDTYAKQVPLSIEALNRKKDGTLFWVDTNVQPMFDIYGELTGFIQISVDITAKKQMILCMQVQATELQRVADVARFASDGVVLTNLEGAIDWFNVAAPNILGCNSEVLESFSLNNIFELFDASFQDALSAALESSTPTKVEAEFLLRPSHWLEIEILPRHIDDLLGGLIIVLLDITERRRKEEALRSSEARLRAIYDVIPVGLVVADNDGVVVNSNHWGYNLLSVAEEDSEHIRTLSTLHPWVVLDEKGQHIKPESLAYNIALQERVQIDNQLQCLLTPSGERWLSVSATPIESPALGVALSYIDVSPQRQQYNALLQAREEAIASSHGKSRFLSNVSREIRIPMNAIMGFLELLNDTELSRKQRDYFEKANMSAKSLLALLENMVDVSKIDSGLVPLDPKLFNTHTFFANLATLLQGNIHPDTELIFDIALSIPKWLKLDALRFQHILLNLISNSLKLTPSGKVSLEIAYENSRLNVVVKDTSIGISPEQQQYIFEDFNLPEPAFSAGALGFGLAIAQRLVCAMGGHLDVMSKQDVGNIFSFSIPCATTEHYPSTPRAKSSAMVVSSDPQVNTILFEMVRTLHTKARTRPSMQEALSCFKSSAVAVDYLYLDVRDEDFSAWHLLQSLEQMEFLSGAKIVLIVHSKNRNHHFQHLIAHSAVQVVSRPITLESLTRASTDINPLSTDSPLYSSRILVVEDNAINQQMFKELLEKKGALVTLAANGKDALEKLAALATNHLPSLILMDLHMPVMDGFEASASILLDPRLCTIPIVAMNASMSSKDKLLMEQIGISHSLEKPLDIGDLLDILNDLST